mgnify:CR=1 FL=1
MSLEYRGLTISMHTQIVEIPVDIQKFMHVDKNLLI